MLQRKALGLRFLWSPDFLPEGNQCRRAVTPHKAIPKVTRLSSILPARLALVRPRLPMPNSQNLRRVFSGQGGGGALSFSIKQQIKNYLRSPFWHFPFISPGQPFSTWPNFTFPWKLTLRPRNFSNNPSLATPDDKSKCFFFVKTFAAYLIRFRFLLLIFRTILCGIHRICVCVYIHIYTCIYVYVHTWYMFIYTQIHIYLSTLNI